MDTVFRKNRQMDRTRQALQAALIALIREKQYTEIEIREITERANTARVTFYRHYATKDELLLDFLAYLYEDLKDTIGEFCADYLLDPLNPHSNALFKLIEQDKDLYRRLLHSPMGIRIQHQVRLYMVEQITTTITPQYAENSAYLIANHIASCTIGNICWWLMAEDEVQDYSAVQMAHLTHSLIISGIKPLVIATSEVG